MRVAESDADRFKLQPGCLKSGRSGACRAQNGCAPGMRNRSTISSAAAVRTISSVLMAIAIANGTAPGTPSSRATAMGIVGVSGRATKIVAPNSPSDTANAKRAPDQDLPADDGQVDLTPRA